MAVAGWREKKSEARTQAHTGRLCLCLVVISSTHSLPSLPCPKTPISSFPHHLPLPPHSNFNETNIDTHTHSDVIEAIYQLLSPPDSPAPTPPAKSWTQPLQNPRQSCAGDLTPVGIQSPRRTAVMRSTPRLWLIESAPQPTHLAKPIDQLR